MDLSLTPTVVVVTVLIVLSVIVMTMLGTMWLAIRWTNRMRDLQVKTLESQLQHLRYQVTDLTNKVLSADAMTYSTLAMQTSYSDSSPAGADHHGLVPSGTDVDEFKRYQQTYGEQLDDESDITEYLVS